MLLDRSGQGKVYNLINRRRFQQMDVLEGLNVLVTISGQRADTCIFSWCLNSFSFLLSLCFFMFYSSLTGKKNKLRVYYLSWLRNRILHNDPEVEKKQGWITVGELEGCVHYKVGTKSHLLQGLYLDKYLKDHLKHNKRVHLWCLCCASGLLCRPPAVKYERIKFLVIALKSSVEIYAWAPKPYHKFMAFKVCCVPLSALSLSVPRSMRANDSLRGTGRNWGNV